MHRKVTQEEFVDQVSKVNPDITIIGEYKGSREKVKCRCATNLNLISQILTDVIATGNSNLLNTKLGGVNTWQNRSA